MLWFVLAAGTTVWVIHDLVQLEHAILRDSPIVGNVRYWLQAVGPELRQYIVSELAVES